MKCKEIKRVDALQSKGLVSKDGESIDGPKSGVCYSIEVKDPYLPPWIISAICSAMSSEGKSYEAMCVLLSFVFLLFCIKGLYKVARDI